jgi:hypothetical protein
MKTNQSFLILLIASIGFWGCNGKKTANDNANSSIVVELQRVQSITANKEISVSGNIEGNKTIKLGFLVAGKVDYIAAE